MFIHNPIKGKRMPYQFKFDLTSISQSFFRDVMRAAYSSEIHKRMGDLALSLVRKFRINEITGLNVSDAVSLMEDFIDIQMKNSFHWEAFKRSKNKVVLLPHCSRKYMDDRCKARFDANVPTYRCEHCSTDCLIHQATLLGEEKGCKMYVLPGGSCIPMLFKQNKVEAVLGIACGEEIKLGDRFLEGRGMPAHALPLIKNGCANTKFNIEELKNILIGS